MKEIKLIQKPIIQHALVEIGASVTERLNSLNVGNLVATSSTIKSIKSLRAELTKELSTYESQRKEIKSAVTAPYMEFETTYKVEVSEKYKDAIGSLKDKIGEFETKVKQEKRDTIESYFTELCLDADIDFVKFADTKIEINLSTSEKKYKEQCIEFVNRISDDIALIKTTEFEAEIMAEYKRTLNASQAITTVTVRKEEERVEKERIQARETQRRVSKLSSISMFYHQMTKTYTWVTDDSIFIEHSEVRALTTEAFEKEFAALEARIDAAIKSQQPVVSPVHPESVFASTPTPAPIPEKPKAEKLAAPTVVKEDVKEKIFNASFKCSGTMAQLKGLGSYMKENNITYSNI